eukprot:COSAG02_NODE_32011_length_523_cov_1.183962_1_plen_24_part_10
MEARAKTPTLAKIAEKAAARPTED